jgi:hypothetical protein
MQPTCVVFLSPDLCLLTGDHLAHVLNHKASRLFFEQCALKLFSRIL